MISSRCTHQRWRGLPSLCRIQFYFSRGNNLFHGEFAGPLPLTVAIPPPIATSRPPPKSQKVRGRLFFLTFPHEQGVKNTRDTQGCPQCGGGDLSPSRQKQTPGANKRRSGCQTQRKKSSPLGQGATAIHPLCCDSSMLHAYRRTSSSSPQSSVFVYN